MSSNHSFYENEIFINSYRKFSQNLTGPNLIEEKPAILSLFPDLTNKKILDLGCGKGENCVIFSKMGAEEVVGVEPSARLLEIANNTNKYSNISYINIDTNEIDKLDDKYDIIFSSLQVHFIKDFGQMLKNIYGLLKENGYFIFSQEHPLTTAPISGIHWTRDDKMNILHYDLTDYSRNGERIISWIINGKTKYHRCISDIINSLIEEGFILEKILEPVPPKELIEKLPYYEKSMHKPNYLIIKVKKA